MEFDEWDPVYRAILDAFGYDRRRDERARDVLGTFVADADTYELERGKDGLERSKGSVSTVAVAGAGPSLEAEAAVARRADLVFAASTAADRLRSEGVAVDLVVTDLDGRPDAVVDWTDEGTPVAVHAHGDNVARLREYVPQCDPAFCLPTTQAAPAGPVRNFGGFTDGDRAAFLADHVGADELTFLGWDFDDPTVDPDKAAKLAWAERLLYWLERRRSETFDVLDGRRDAVDASALPVE